MSAVAVIGLGNIGAGCAQAVARDGHDVRGFDVRSEASADLSDILRPAESPADAASGADVVLIAVYDGAQVREALTGDGGILAADPLPKTVAILTTCEIETIEWVGEQGRAAGVGVLDCGVTGGAAALTQGGMAALVGSDDATFEGARAVIESFGSPVLRMGPLGAGMKAKLARNAIVFGMWYVVAEAAKLAQTSGVDLTNLIEACEAADLTSGGPYALVGKYGCGPILPEGGPSDEGLALRQGFVGYAHKDVGAFLSLASDLGLDFPVAEIVAQDFETAVGLEKERT